MQPVEFPLDGESKDSSSAGGDADSGLGLQPSRGDSKRSAFASESSSEAAKLGDSVLAIDSASLARNRLLGLLRGDYMRNQADEAWVLNQARVCGLSHLSCRDSDIADLVRCVSGA